MSLVFHKFYRISKIKLMLCVLAAIVALVLFWLRKKKNKPRGGRANNTFFVVSNRDVLLEDAII